MDEQQRRQLYEQVYLIFKHVLTPAEIEGDHAGEENYIEPGVRHLANLANKGEIFRGLYAHPQVLEVVEAVIGPEVPPQTALAPRERKLLGLHDE